MVFFHLIMTENEETFELNLLHTSHSMLKFKMLLENASREKPVMLTFNHITIKNTFQRPDSPYLYIDLFNLGEKYGRCFESYEGCVDNKKRRLASFIEHAVPGESGAYNDMPYYENRDMITADGVLKPNFIIIDMPIDFSKIDEKDWFHVSQIDLNEERTDGAKIKVILHITVEC